MLHYWVAMCFNNPNCIILFLFRLLCQVILNCQKISSLAESTSSKVVFNEVLATSGRDIVTKDISRLRGGWPMQDAFYVSPFRRFLCVMNSLFAQILPQVQMVILILLLLVLIG